MVEEITTNEEKLYMQKYNIYAINIKNKIKYQ